MNKMNDRIKNKIFNAFNKYKTHCCTGIIRDIHDRERKVIIVGTCNRFRDIYFIGNTGINLNCYSNILYVRDLEDIAFNVIFDK